MENHERSMGFQIKTVNNLIRRQIDAMFAEKGMTEVCGMQGPLIGYVYDKSKERDVFQKDIEQHFQVRRSTATVMLQNMEQKGLIVRIPVEHDARMKKIVLTQKAVECHYRIREQLDAFNARLEEGVTSEEKEQFYHILDKIIDNLA